MRRNRILSYILSLAVVSSTIIYATPESSAQTFNKYQDNSNAPADDSNFTTIFAFPYKTVKKNEEVIKKMNADMITFGPRIYPPNAWEDKGSPDYPQELIDALGTDQLYYFAGDVEWENNSNGKKIETSQGDWYAIKSAGKWVVNKKGSNKYMNAAQAANNVGADFYLGMPIPQRWEKQPWLIDGSYRDVMRSFNEEYVKNYRSVVDGYYQMGEITLNASNSWKPFFDNFEDQFEAIRKNDPDAIVINSPYIRSAKTNDKNKVINDSVEGYKKLLNMSKGLNFVLAPQDGLGTDTTALKKDNSTRHSVTTEEVFEALSKVNKDRLFSNTENMIPDFTDGKRDPNTGELLNGQRKITTVDRVKDQVAAVKNDVSGFIAFMWNNTTPMTKVDGIEELLDGGFGGLKEISYKADDRFTVSDAYNISYDKSTIKQSESKKLSPVMKEGNDDSNKSSRYLYSGGKWEVENGYPWITVNQLGDITIKPTDKVKPGQYDPKVTVTFNDNSKQVVPLSINVSGTTTSKPTSDKPTTPKPTSDKPTTPKPTSDKPTSDKPTTPKPTSDKPTTSKPTTNKPTSDKPTTSKPTTSKPTTNKPTSDKPTTPKPTSDKPTAPKPTSDKPTTSSPTADKPVDNPTTDKPTTSSSATDKPSVESSTSDDVSSTINNDNKNDDTSSLTTTTTSSDTTPTTKDTPTTIKEDIDSTSTTSSSTQEDTDNTDNTDNKNDDNLNKFSPIKNKKNETVNKKGSQSAPLNNNSQQVRDNQKVVNDEELDSPQDTLKVDTGGSITKNIAVMIKQIFN